jgi:hypothetical protein
VAYIPDHIEDVFISYSHADDFAWIERFEQDLRTILIRKLRARTQPAIFFDAHDLRAGRVFDADIPDCLEQTGFFLAMVSPRYNTSTYCIHKELAKFLRRQKPESGRLIQLILDLSVSAALPVENSLAIPFADARGAFQAGTDAYLDALRKVYEPIVTELDKLYAASKIVFLAWPDDPQMEEERNRLESEIEGRGLRVGPTIAEFQSDVRLREALAQCTTSVHLFGDQPGKFDLRQWDAADSLGKPCVLASRSVTETRRGPAGSPAPIYLNQGNPTIAIAKAIEQIAGIGRRDAREAQQSLGRTPVFLIFKPDADATLGLKIRKRIISRGPFEVIVPRNDSTRYEELRRAKLALVCRAKAGRAWLQGELEALDTAMATSGLLDLRRALLVPSPDDGAGVETFEGEEIVGSEEALDALLAQVQGAAA